MSLPTCLCLDSFHRRTVAILPTDFTAKQVQPDNIAYYIHKSPTRHSPKVLATYASTVTHVCYINNRQNKTGSYIQQSRNVRSQRRPRDLRVRALDPDHFTCPPLSHGAVHQQRPGVVPVEGHISVIGEPLHPSRQSPQEQPSPPPCGIADDHSGGRRCNDRASSGGVQRVARRARVSAASTSASVGRTTKTPGAVAAAAAVSAAAAAAEVAAAVGADDCGIVFPTLPGMHEFYHLDAASLDGFGAAAEAAMRALEDLLAQVGGDRTCGVSSSANGGRRAVCLPPPGVASLLLTSGGHGNVVGGSGGGKVLVETIAGVRDKFVELVAAAAALGAVVPCAPEGAGLLMKMLVFLFRPFSRNL